jgi:hypothetical protein
MQKKALLSNEAAVDHWFMRKGLDYMREHAWQTFANGLRKISAAYRGESQGQQLLRAIFIGAIHNRPLSYACQQAERKKSKIGAVFRPLSSSTQHRT